MQPIINALLDPVVNFGKVTVSTGYTREDTAITLILGDGAKLPNPVPDGSFNIVWFNNSTYSDPADDPNVEIVRCIARVGDVLTLMRAQEGTSETAKNIAGKIYKMLLSPTKKTIDDIQIESQSKVSTHSALTTGVHGIGVDTIDGVGARNIAISSHSSVASNVHGFNSSGDAPAQTHGLSKHTGTIGDHAANLSSIGSNTHAQIDTHMGATVSIHNFDIVGNAPAQTHGSTRHDATVETPTGSQSKVDAHSNLTTTHGSSGAILGVTTADATYAPIANGVTNGNSHDHNGGDGAQINHTTLSNIGTNTHAQIDTAISNSTNHIASPSPHSGHDTPSQRDTAIGTAIDTHTDLTTGVHGVTGSVLGTEDIGTINGIAGLDANAKVPTSQLPGLAITNVYTTVSQVAQLALLTTTQEGDVVIRTDENKSYVRNSGVSGTMADYSLLLTPTDVVISVFGRTGVVAASNNDYTWAQINKTTSNIADITTRSHASLADIGTNTHTQIDTHIAASGTSVHGLGTISTQAANNVAIIGGSVSGIADLAVADGGTGASTAAAARLNLGFGVVASDNIIFSSDAQTDYNSIPTTPTLIKSITITRKLIGTQRIVFNAFEDGYGYYATYVKLYKNGSALGTVHRAPSSEETFSEDITQNWEVGDTCEIYGWNVYPEPNHNLRVKLFRIKFDSGSLGLGPLSMQDKDNVSITGGSIGGTRVNPRTTTIVSSATPTPDSDASDYFTVTALAEVATFGAPTGTPINGQKLTIRIKDNATARALSWNAIYRAGTDIILPTTTVISKTMYVGFIYNSTDSKWDLVAFIWNI